MKNIFNAVQFGKPKRNKFDLSHERKMSFKMGQLIPMFFEEVLPGDSFRVSSEMLLRLQPLLAPIMHRVRVQTDFFYVPNRLVWDNWDKFISGGEDGTDMPVPPYMATGAGWEGYFSKGKLSDFLGLPVADSTVPMVSTPQFSALPFRAYHLIYNEYYRDQNLTPKVIFSKGDGRVPDPDMDALANIRNRAWEKDYFTSCLPWAQKGGSVSIPNTQNFKEPATAEEVSGAPLSASALTVNAAGEVRAGAGGTERVVLDTLESIGISINDLRTSNRLQEWLEKNARAGSRLAEFILAHFGVMSDDLRLGRPQYLGGHTNPVVISEVLSSYQNADDTGYPQGNMSGHGISTGGNAGFKGQFKEHGFVFGIMSVLPRTAYQQGVPKTFLRKDKFDYAFPSFAHLGEQAVDIREIYQDYLAEQGDVTFGYQSRYAEYKYKASSVHGDFRSNLAFWHMGRIFGSTPQLNDSFVTSNPDKRVFAVTTQDEDELLCQIYNRVDALRVLPYFSNPTL